MKSNLLVNVDSEILLELRSRHINMSSLINSFLKEYLNLKDMPNSEEILQQEIIKIKSNLVAQEKALESIKDKKQKEYNKKHGVIKSEPYIK